MSLLYVDQSRSYNIFFNKDSLLAGHCGLRLGHV